MNQAKIIAQLKGGDRERAFSRLYNYFPKIERHIKMNSGSKEEALDIFQEALIILYKKVLSIDKSSAINMDGFLVNTCKLLWKNELRKKKVRKNSGEDGLQQLEFADEIAEQVEKERKISLIESILNEMGKTCKEMLNAFYYKRLSMDKIAKQFGYKTVQSAKTKKYKCMEHARKMALAASTTLDVYSQAETNSIFVLT
ncbi:MAG: RNA polymerase sigma factor [Crocinitomicaceae bacterium]